MLPPPSEITGAAPTAGRARSPPFTRDTHAPSGDRRGRRANRSRQQRHSDSYRNSSNDGGISTSAQ